MKLITFLPTPYCLDASSGPLPRMGSLYPEALSKGLVDLLLLLIYYSCKIFFSLYESGSNLIYDRLFFKESTWMDDRNDTSRANPSLN